jgi:hypothetical protein
MLCQCACALARVRPPHMRVEHLKEQDCPPSDCSGLDFEYTMRSGQQLLVHQPAVLLELLLIQALTANLTVILRAFRMCVDIHQDMWPRAARQTPHRESRDLSKHRVCEFRWLHQPSVVLEEDKR